MATNDLRNRNKKLAFVLAGLVVAMTGLAFASVPLYRLFCQVTGYGGTPRQAEAVTTIAQPLSERVIDVTFTADVAEGLGWRFQPDQRHVTLKIGEKKQALYIAQNLESKEVTGQATFNVSPEIFAPYFMKVECFCFEEQKLGPGERAEMPVIFYIDPAILEDPKLAKLDHVTLSYTFFRAASSDEKQNPVATN